MVALSMPVAADEGGLYWLGWFCYCKVWRSSSSREIYLVCA